MDIFRDYFTREQLLLSLAKVPFIPGRLSEYFDTRGLTGTTFSIEQRPENAPQIMASTPRGTPSKVETLEKRNVYSFDTVHKRYDGSVYADEVLNMRGMGVNVASEVIIQRRDDLIMRLRNDVDLTLESLRVACLATPSNAFGNMPASAQIALNTDATKTRAEIFTKIRQPIRTALGGIPFTGIKALCSATFWAKLIENAAIKATLLNYSMAQSLRGETTEMVNFGGVSWEFYDGTGTVVIPTGEARVFPIGIPQMWQQAFAPADTLDTVGAGALGVPYYMQAIPSRDNRSWYIEMQTNPVMVCTRPTAVLQITTD